MESPVGVKGRKWQAADDSETYINQEIKDELLENIKNMLHKNE